MSTFLVADYRAYVRRCAQRKNEGILPPWHEPLEFDEWLSRQSIDYLNDGGWTQPELPLW